MLFQMEGLLIHCLRGKNRTAQPVAALLLAVYHESKVTVEDVMEYILALRPICTFEACEKFEKSPVVPRGGEARRTDGVNGAACPAGGGKSMRYRRNMHIQIADLIPFGGLI